MKTHRPLIDALFITLLLAAGAAVEHHQYDTYQFSDKERLAFNEIFDQPEEKPEDDDE